MKILDTLGKSKKAIGGVIAIIVLVIAIFFAGVHYASGSNNDKITSTTIKNQLTEINELALYSYDYSKVGKFSNKLNPSFISLIFSYYIFYFFKPNPLTSAHIASPSRNHYFSYWLIVNYISFIT